MKIFIDESGVFKKNDKSEFSVSCVGALIIADCHFPKLIKKYEKLRESFPQTASGEVKGKNLNEEQVAKVIDLLRRNNALFEAVLIDMNVQDGEALKAQRKVLKENHSKQLSETTQEKYKRTLSMLTDSLDQMSDQLFVQFCLTTRLLGRVIYHAPTYFSLRQPKELAAFEWCVDAKNKDKVTSAEKWWRLTVSPFLSTLSKTEPAPVLQWGDYTYYDQSYGADIEDWPEIDESKATNGTDLSKLFSNFTFSSNADLGLELVDIVTNTLRRALSDNLQESGWAQLPELVISRADQESIPFIIFSDDGPISSSDKPYLKTYNKLKKGRKSMLTRRISDLAAEEIKNGE